MYIGNSINDQIKLTTFKKIEESLIEKHGILVEKVELIKCDDEEERKSITEEDGDTIVTESS